MTKLLLVGDSHGNAGFMGNSIRAARELDCDAVVQLGDFGFWPGLSGEMFLESVHKHMAQHEMPVWVIDGNHDWPELYCSMSYSPTLDYFVTVQHVPRGTVLELDGRKIGFLGSAVSIDQERRTPGRSWWPEEVLSQDDVTWTLLSDPAIDIMLSHDAPIPPHMQKLSFGKEIDAAIDLQAERLHTVIEHWRPKLHVHGHWHTPYRCPTPWGVRVGLSHENGTTGIAVLDVASLTLD